MPPTEAVGATHFAAGATRRVCRCQPLRLSVPATEAFRCHPPGLPVPPTGVAAGMSVPPTGAKTLACVGATTLPIYTGGLPVPSTGVVHLHRRGSPLDPCGDFRCHPPARLEWRCHASGNFPTGEFSPIFRRGGLVPPTDVHLPTDVHTDEHLPTDVLPTVLRPAVLRPAGLAHPLDWLIGLRTCWFARLRLHVSVF